MILAHDLGTTGNKASLYSDAGELITTTTVEYHTEYGPRGRVEQNPEDWWSAVISATRFLLERASVRPQDIECVSFSGQMMGVVLLDGEGQPLRPAIIWADTRSQKECELLIERVGMERCYEITGHRINPTYSLSKLMWVRDNEPEIWSRAQAFLLSKDYVAFRLTGRISTDPSDASGTDAYDQREGRWSKELLEAASIDESLMPPILPSTEILGGITREAASQTGLIAGTPVVLGGGDGPCAAVGAGITTPGSGAYAYLGSSSWVSLASEKPLLDPKMRTMTFNHVVPDRFVPTATMQAGGASMEWICDILSPRRNSERYEELMAAAAETEAADEGLLFLPYLLGERSPYWNPRARGAFIGLSKHHGPAQLARAVMEGVAMNLKVGLLAFEEQGEMIESIDAIGGGARSDVWLQIFADVWGKTVRRRSLVDEANSLGAAVIGGVGVGIFDDFEVAARLSHIEKVFEPDLQRVRRYEARYSQFLEAYKRLETLFDDLQRE
ncbi:Xylulose kinase [Rubrobacter xylanophilus DSM 9941]|uniref:xylulokinase n=1 Tax=Rubrobacter xylanophilus TaxID=49319 RepID=UPI001C63C174|nr:xylulokinase [Rubrobacter xylanophilus]QYJ17124.1 Xylulose kinase [Rubrobacter xylanophilus DSM 9941]